MFNFIQMLKTGIKLSTPKNTEELSEDESDIFEECIDHTDTELASDAAVQSNIRSTFPDPKTILHLDNLSSFLQELDQQEVVSVAYLLHTDDPEELLNILNCYLTNSLFKNPILIWAERENSTNKLWQSQLIEAFCIIQNYKILRMLGYDKTSMKEHYLPHREVSLRVNKVKKVLYNFCEKLDEHKSDVFLSYVKDDFIRKQIKYKPYSYLELYFLYWETIGYVKKNDYKHVLKIIKILDMGDIYDVLEKILPVEQVTTINRSSSKTVDNQHASKSKPYSTDMSGDSSISSFSNNFTMDDMNSSCYHIDPNNPGICLIINQNRFYTEYEKQYVDLLPANREILEPRDGTEKDRDTLAQTFQKFGYKVIIKNDLTHLEILTCIEETVKSVTTESSLIVCIMSHGDRGLVYGVNSCRVEVATIQNMMCMTNYKNLSNKPKVLILQSCQGKYCQKVIPEEDLQEEHDNITTDGGSSSKNTAPTTNMLTFWATVPGYAAIRHKRTGSWFIQSLCNKLQTLSNECHFEDICTRIMADVTNKRWKKNDDEVVMVPVRETTFTKSFYLPKIPL